MGIYLKVIRESYMNDEIRVNYVAENCYSLEIGDYFLVFDYYNGILNIPADKKLVFFATSKNKGHYSPEILKLFDMKNVIYFLATDIAYDRSDGKVIYLKNKELSIERLKEFYKKKNVTFLKEYKNIKVNKDLDVYCYGASETGLSLVIRIYDFLIFYTGDRLLSQKERSLEELSLYLYDIYEDFEEVDLAFFPIKTEKNERIYDRAKAFIEILNPQILFPLNIGDDFELSRDFKKSLGNTDTDIRSLIEDNQAFVIDMDYE